MPYRPAIMPSRFSAIEPASSFTQPVKLTISPMPNSGPNMLYRPPSACGAACGGGWRGDRATVINIGVDEDSYGGRGGDQSTYFRNNGGYDHVGCGCNNNHGGGDASITYRDRPTCYHNNRW